MNRPSNFGSAMVAPDAGPPVGEIFAVAVRVGGPVSPAQMRIDGVNLAFNASGIDLTPNDVRPLCIEHGFGLAPVNNVLGGAIGEVLVFDRYWSDEEFAFVSTYMESKWISN